MLVVPISPFFQQELETKHVKGKQQRFIVRLSCGWINNVRKKLIDAEAVFNY